VCDVGGMVQPLLIGVPGYTFACEFCAIHFKTKI
jgi:hypothetical protein